MPFRVPIDMIPLDRLADIPIFASSVHSWINALWIEMTSEDEWTGDVEWQHVIFDIDQLPKVSLHRSFMDYDPISGKVIRQAIRAQFNMRVERGPLFSNIISSQGRCSPPTKFYGKGYGCFAYIPLFWFEDAKVIYDEEIYRLNDHFYLRPARYQSLLFLGAIVGVVCMFIGTVCIFNENYHRNRYQKRVYVD